MAENEQVAVREVVGESLTLKQVTDRVNLVHEILGRVMKKGTHYGTVPGCGVKMVLLKPGADVLAMTFRLVPRFEVTTQDLGAGHKEYTVTCSMYSPEGTLLGQGVGSASSMEKKYRYRKNEQGVRIENEDIADVQNTVLKIAKKRAHIDATLTVTGAADIFTQDLIDEDEPKKEPVKMPTETPGPAASHAAGGETAEVVLEACQSKTGKGAKGEWTRFYAKADDGEYYSTFDTKIGTRMTELAGQPASILFKTETTAKGTNRTILDIQPVVVAGQEPREPGAEG